MKRGRLAAGLIVSWCEGAERSRQGRVNRRVGTHGVVCAREDVGGSAAGWVRLCEGGKAPGKAPAPCGKQRTQT